MIERVLMRDNEFFPEGDFWAFCRTEMSNKEQCELYTTCHCGTH